MTSQVKAGLIGGTSPVGQQIIRLFQEQGIPVVALSRNSQPKQENIIWLNVGDSNYERKSNMLADITIWISVGPIWILPQYFDLIAASGAKRIVSISSTSRFTKTTSSSAYEEVVVDRLIHGERSLMNWASSHAIEWSIIRPTLIYGRSTDRNLSEIVRIIKKFKVFPLFGKAAGLRQPVYVDDVAAACVQAAFAPAAVNKDYNISGAEILTYEEMVRRIFVAMHRKPRILRINLTVFRLALWFLKRIPRYSNWNADMVQRMNRDMVFSHDAARSDFNFKPRRFELSDIDVK